MKEKYIGIKIIEAEPGSAPKDMGTHKAGEDGYLVTHEDGYESWSPKKVFDDAYRNIEGMTFGIAQELAKRGKKIRRDQWDQWNNVFLVDDLLFDDGDPHFVEPCYMMMWDGNLSLWTPSMEELLAEDWVVVE